MSAVEHERRTNAVSSWHVADAEAVAPALLRERIGAMLDGRLRSGERALRMRSGGISPWVAVQRRALADHRAAEAVHAVRGTFASTVTLVR